MSLEALLAGPQMFSATAAELQQLRTASTNNHGGSTVRLFWIGCWISVLLGSAGQVRADFITDTLGSAGPGNYAILNIGTGKADVALTGPGTTTGNVGVLS